MDKRKLYEITADMQQVMDMKEDTPDDVYHDTMESLQGDLTDKVKTIICVRKNRLQEMDELEAYRQTLLNEASNIKALIDERDRENKRMDNYVMDCLESVGINGVHTMAGNCYIKLSERVETANDFEKWAQRANRDDLLDFGKPKPNKAAIKAALKSGEILPAEIVKGRSLVVR